MQLKSIQLKITLWAGFCTLVIATLLIGYSAFSTWSILIETVPVATATNGTWKLVNTLILAGGLMSGLAFAALWFLAGRIAEPIKTAAQFAENLAAGNATQAVTVTAQDETGQLLTSLNSMLESAGSMVQSEENRKELQQSIIKLLEQVSDVAQGDLTREVSVSGDVTGTIADSFNYMIAELRRIIGQVQNVSHQVSSTANVTQDSTINLVREAEEQASQISQTTEAIAEMADSIQRVTENALLSATVAQESLSNARQGTEAVQNTIQGMQRIRDQVQDTSKKLKRLGESSQEIGEIVQIIGGISKRTSYLALNAAIQAAEAGETGHGFAIVAEEIDRLAKRAAEATKRINALVKTIQSGANEAISAMEESTREVVDGSHLANQAGQALNEIQSVSERLAELIASISQASAEQNQSSLAVSSAMARISDITQRTANEIKQSSQSVSTLATLADELRDSVASFKLPHSR